ncbi:MAG: hypothetical protein LBE13_21045 [Bacteroidales bacterium]|jgi:hypothetical protein|nr:hypothetical protein [Bacteroidales bacterium]
MKKKELKVNYKGSGVKTLEVFGTIFLVLGPLALLTALIGLSLVGEVSLIIASAFSQFGCAAFVIGAVCMGLSSIAKTALYKRTILEEQYELLNPCVKDPIDYITNKYIKKS